MFHSISINFMKHPALALPQFTVTIALIFEARQLRRADILIEYEADNS